MHQGQEQGSGKQIDRKSMVMKMNMKNDKNAKHIKQDDTQVLVSVWLLLLLLISVLLVLTLLLLL